MTWRILLFAFSFLIGMQVRHENNNIYILNGGDEWTVERFVYLKEKYPTSQVLMIDERGEKYLAQFKTLEVVNVQHRF